MCRISGIVNEGSTIEDIQAQVLNMCNLQKHGGPDDGGIYVSSNDKLVLGNRRLALLDLTEEGHMPMSYAGRFFITYNGELYNFLGLKQELVSLGHSFKNHTDTEVILASFAQWGTQSFAKLKGMFAFALWDNTEKELFLVRDPAGIKPLYYAARKQELVFASEIRAFQGLPGYQEQNKDWPVFLMAYGHVPEPVTTLSLVKSLQKGCFLKYDLKKGTYSLQSFSHYSYSDQFNKADNVTDIIKRSLTSSVERQLLADAPIGVFLSGGLDSAILTALASSVKKTDLKTLSIYFEEPEYSEKKYQDILINKLQCSHYQYLLKEDEFNDSFFDILSSMDMPSCDGINTWFISKQAASQGLKAVLSGIGGDELFGGYPSFNRIAAANFLQELPNLMISAGRRSNFKRLKRMSYLKMDGIKGIYLFLRGHFSPFDIAQQLGTYESEVWRILEEEPLLMNIDGLDHKNQASWMEFNLYMQNQLLRDSDVMSMTHGVEIRVPFLDDDIVRLALSIRASDKYIGPNKKQILINSFEDILPPEIWNRPKMGFSFPFAKWLASGSHVKELINQGNPIVKNKYEKFKQGKLHWSHMMSLILLTSRKVA